MAGQFAANSIQPSPDSSSDDSPVEYRRFLLLDIVAGHIAALLASVHHTPPVLRVVEQQETLLFAQTELVRALRLIVVLGRHPTLFGTHPLTWRAVTKAS